MALGAFKNMVISSVVAENLTKKIWAERFRLNGNNARTPMAFQLMFTFESNIYRYGFQIKDGKIKSEWLFSAESNNFESEELFFVREKTGLNFNKTHFPKNSSYLKTLNSETNEIFRADALFLTSVAINGNKMLSKLRDEIKNIITIDGTDSDSGLQLALHILEKGDAKEKKALKNFLKYSDTGIHDFSIIDLPYAPDSLQTLPSEFLQKKNLKTVVSSHIVYDHNNKPLKQLEQDNFFKWESKGSIKLLGLSAIILRTLKNGQTLIIDEFDSSLHPNLSLKIIQLFNSTETNPNNAQLIVITHDDGLMRRSKLRRDQIVLVNKDQYGRSTIKTLIEYKGIRKDQSFDKEYLDGSYAGIPNLIKLDTAVLDYLK